MKNSILLLLTLLVLQACTETEKSPNTNTTTVKVTEPSTATSPTTPTPTTTNSKPKVASLPKTLQLSDCVGIYSKSGHDESWLLGVREYDGRVEGLLMKFEGMLPPLASLQGNAPIKGASSQQLVFEINLDTRTFSSELGDGIIDGTKVVFSGQTDLVNDNLALFKDDDYAALLED